MKKEKKRKLPSTPVLKPFWIVMQAASILVLSVSIAFSLTGCARKLVLHPISQQDIFLVEEGQEYFAEAKGACFSDKYITEILNAKLELE